MKDRRFSLTEVDAEFAAVLAALSDACLDGFFSAQERWDAEAMARLLAMPGARALLILPADGDETGRKPAPLGFGVLRVVADEAEIITLGVLPQERRAGGGSVLLNGMLSLAAVSGAARLYLEVAEDNAPARGLYESFGFRPAGRRKAYYRRDGGPAADALLLARALEGGASTAGEVEGK